MNLSDIYAPAAFGALGGVVGYALRTGNTSPFLPIVAGAGGGVAVGLIANAMRAESKGGAGPELSDNPNAPKALPMAVPPPPDGRPIIPAQAEAMFGAQAPDPQCFGAWRSYYGVHAWNEGPDGLPNPVWDLLGRWQGNLLTTQMLPFLDQFYGTGYGCTYNKGVWAVAGASDTCPAGSSFVQVGKSRADCGLPPVAVAKG